MREIERRAESSRTQEKNSQTVGGILAAAFIQERNHASIHPDSKSRQRLEGLKRLRDYAELWGVSGIALSFATTQPEPPDVFEEVSVNETETIHTFLERIKDETGRVPKSRARIFGEALHGLMLLDGVSKTRLAEENDLSRSTVTKILTGEGGSPESIGKVVSYLLVGKEEQDQIERDGQLAQEVFRTNPKETDKKDLAKVLGKWVSGMRASEGMSKTELSAQAGVPVSIVTKLEKGEQVSRTALGKMLHSVLYSSEQVEQEPSTHDGNIVGQFLKRLRLANDIARGEISKGIGISSTLLDKLEKGDELVSAEYYGRYIVYLLAGPEALVEKTKSTMQSRACGSVIRTLRKESNITLEEFSERSGITVEELSDIEMGESLDPLKITYIVTTLDGYQQEKKQLDILQLKLLKELPDAELIKYLRKEKKLTQPELAESIGINREELSRLENNKLLTQIMKARILDQFKETVPVKELLYETLSEMPLTDYMKFLRLRNKMVLSDVADKLSISKEAVSQLERGITLLTTTRESQYTEALAIEPAFAKLLNKKVKAARAERAKKVKERRKNRSY